MIILVIDQELPLRVRSPGGSTFLREMTPWPFMMPIADRIVQLYDRQHQKFIVKNRRSFFEAHGCLVHILYYMTTAYHCDSRVNCR